MEDWHLSKNVPITLFLLLIIQTVSVSGAFTEVEVGVKENAKDIANNTGKTDALEKRTNTIEVRLARMDENIIHIKEMLESRQ